MRADITSVDRRDLRLGEETVLSRVGFGAEGMNESKVDTFPALQPVTDFPTCTDALKECKDNDAKSVTISARYLAACCSTHFTQVLHRRPACGKRDWRLPHL